MPKEIIRTVLLVQPHADSEGLDIAPATVDLKNLEAIASKLGVTPLDLRWLRHDETVYIGCAQGAVYHSISCEAHTITLRGRTLVMRISDDQADEEDVDIQSVQEATMADAERATTCFLPGEGRFELRSMLSSPLVNVSNAIPPGFAEGLSAGLPPGARVVVAKSLGDAIAQIMGGMGLDPDGDISGVGQKYEVTAAEQYKLVPDCTYAPKFEFNFNMGKNFPSALLITLATLQAWTITLLRSDNTLPIEAKEQHMMFFHSMVIAVKQCLLANEESYKALINAESYANLIAACDSYLKAGTEH